MNVDNVAIIKDLYAKFDLSDFEGIRSIFSDNIEWNQMEGFPNGGRYFGADEIFNNVFRGFKADWISWKAEVTEWLDAGSHIIVIGYYEGVHKQTNMSMKSSFAHRYMLENGRIVKFNQYADTMVVAQAMGVIIYRK